MKNLKEIICSYFDKNLKNIFNSIDDKIFNLAEEIRLRVQKPLYFRIGKNEYFINNNGICPLNECYIVKREDIIHTIELISGFSIYAFQEEICQGYITLPGGIRIGIAGQAVFENNGIKNIKNISSLNIRIPREIKGCAENVINFITKDYIKNTLIISPPGIGKTTLLRDIIRRISDGDDNKFGGFNIGVVDERNEIAGSYMGINQNDIGIRTDVIERCPKYIGMNMLIRSMAPQIIAVDEIGNKEDIYTILNIINSGVKFICTIHGKSIDDIKQKEEIKIIIEKKIFDIYIVLSGKNGAGTIEAIYNKNFQILN